jgi:type IV pilus assembly protein PilZ
MTSISCCRCPTILSGIQWPGRSLITPANASGGRTQGVGVRFPNDEKTRLLKLKIEELLGTQLQSAKPTQTI